LKALTENIKEKTKRLSSLSCRLLITDFSGLFLAILGFWLWYKRVQIYQDEALRNASEISEKQKAASLDLKSRCVFSS
jgi:hypothetical protein